VLAVMWSRLNPSRRKYIVIFIMRRFCPRDDEVAQQRRYALPKAPQDGELLEAELNVRQ
jgi:hypothetical protein